MTLTTMRAKHAVIASQKARRNARLAQVLRRTKGVSLRMTDLIVHSAATSSGTATGTGQLEATNDKP
jgi:hypothetical protein